MVSWCSLYDDSQVTRVYPLLFECFCRASFCGILQHVIKCSNVVFAFSEPSTYDCLNFAIHGRMFLSYWTLFFTCKPYWFWDPVGTCTKRANLGTFYPPICRGKKCKRDGGLLLCKRAVEGKLCAVKGGWPAAAIAKTMKAGFLEREVASERQERLGRSGMEWHGAIGSDQCLKDFQTLTVGGSLLTYRWQRKEDSRSV